jgi:fluoride ion exporter CrcB/FEX
VLSDIWVCITGAISGDDRFYVSRLVRQRCAMPFDPHTFAANINGLFITGLLAGLSEFQGAIARHSVDSPTTFERAARQFGYIGESESDPMAAWRLKKTARNN